MDRAVAWVTARPGVVLISLTLCYAVFGLWALAPDAEYLGDIGVKYVQAHAIADHNTPVDFAPFKKRKTERRGRMTLQFWER
jgi:hypothetical protein